MDWEIERNGPERIADATAAAIFAAAVAFAHTALAGGGAASAVVAVAAFLVAETILGRVAAGEPMHCLPAFDLVPIETSAEESPESPSELSLDDPLVAPDPDARVVQLFGPGSRPEVRVNGPADESQALVEALLELRRSLR